MGPWSIIPDMGTVLYTRLNGSFVQIQDGFRSKEMLGPIKGADFLEAALAMDCIYGFQSTDGVNVNPSKQKQVSSGNSMPFNSTGTKRGSLCRLKESSFVLVALNVTSHMSPLSTILHRSYSSLPADPTFSKKNGLTKTGIKSGVICIDAYS